ncbi:hypothetical protein PPYR_08962 [Photinus pyralis]|uniref:C2H2-type domain-containing protein n=5 Tax=Photinus pyralis TaxID=7054 RepID=A0A1Y1MRC5_PHOPY|nr:zinc finger protein 197-like [Photinus pyralis]KAB0797969.1 hypothetical protein PPYR_08962 [Photinus pyralis]
MSEIENSDPCGICGEAHRYSQCECVPFTKHIPDKVALTRARATLPEVVNIRTMADGTYAICANTFIGKGTQLGPLEARTLLTLNPIITFPLKLFSTNEEDLSGYYLDTADEYCCNWIIFISPAQHAEEQNVICFQHKSEIIYMCLKDVHPGDYLKVWYSDYYGKKMGKKPLMPYSLSIPTKNTDMPKEPVDMNKLLKEQQKLVDRENWTCKFCGKLENDIARFSNHIIDHYTRKKVNVNCDECEGTFSTKKNLRVHMRKVHNKSIAKEEHKSSETDNVKPKESIVGGPLLNSLLADSLDNTNLMLSNMDLNLNVLENDALSLAVDNLLTENVKELDHFNFDITETQEQFVCDICLKVFTKLRYLIQHLRTHTGRFTCTYCLKIFCRKENLIMHSCERDTSLIHACTICGKTFSSEKYLDRHTNLVHKGVYLCEKCNKKNHSQKDYKNHNCTALSNSAKQVFPCSTCGKKFFHIRYLRKHAKRHKQKEKVAPLNENFTCEVCGANHKTRAGLFLHKKTHSNPSFQCPLCEKKFHKSDTLREHKLYRHSDQKVTCTICKKELKNERILKVHMKLHTNLNTYKCDKCPCSYAQASSLKAHKFTVHLNRCKVCHKEFPSADLLAIHQKSHVLKEFYVCPICSKCMKLRTSLVRHIKKFHPDQDHVALVAKMQATPADLVLPSEEQSDKENVIAEQSTLSQLVSTHESDDSNFDSIVDNFENIMNSYNVNSNDNLSLTAYTDPKTSDDREMLDFTDLQMDIESSFDVGSIGISNQDICLSMPDLTEADQEIMLGDNAFIMENGTIVEPKDQGNVLVYVLDKNL